MSEIQGAPSEVASSPLLRVDSVRVRHFRGIEDATIALHPTLTLLVGRNNSGKSRILRAIALACGGTAAQRDDFTVGEESEPILDLVLAPPAGEPHFDDRVREVFGTHVQPTSAIGDERIAWRVTISHSSEGWGARAATKFLDFDAGSQEWTPSSTDSDPNRNQRNVIAADLTSTARDLAAELTKPGTSIRRVLDDLEIADSEQTTLEADLQGLGSQILSASGALKSIRAKLEDLERSVTGVGTPHLSALPGRLEELFKLIDIGLDTGSGPLPMRMHGSGSRSLASLQVQSVFYDRRLGRDGSDFPTFPVTLVEEPEAHLHPQACFDLSELLGDMPGQCVVSTHSSHLLTAVDLDRVRLIRQRNQVCEVYDCTPSDRLPTTPAALRLDVASAEWEKIKRLIERPFGELLFASAIVIGDGAAERGFLPHILKAALGPRASEVTVVDPGAMSQAEPLIKYAEAAGIPCILFVDCDHQGRRDEKALRAYAQRVWATGDAAVDGTIEEILASHDEDWALRECQEHLPIVSGSALERLKLLKGTYGSPLGRAFVRDFPEPSTWPPGFQALIQAVREA